MHKTIILLAAGAVLLSSSAAFAFTATDQFQATVTITSSCLIDASDLDFGSLGVITGTETATADVVVTCTAGTAYDLSFSSNVGDVTDTGLMIGGSEDVAYNVSLSSSSGTGSGVSSILGSLPAQSTPSAGVYSVADSLTVIY